MAVLPTRNTSSPLKLCGTGKDHCCYLEGKPCPHVRKSDRKGYVWDCGLRADLGDWDAVHSSTEYLRDVKPIWDKHGVTDCGDWKPNARGCADCGEGV